MDFRDSPEEAAFRDEVRGWLADHLTGEFAALGGRGGPADEEGWETRVEWAKVLGNTEAHDLLSNILDQEKAANNKLTHLAVSAVNQTADA